MTTMFFSISIQKEDEQGRWKNCKEFNDVQRSKRKPADISMGVLPLAFLYAICLSNGT